MQQHNPIHIQNQILTEIDQDAEQEMLQQIKMADIIEKELLKYEKNPSKGFLMSSQKSSRQQAVGQKSKNSNTGGTVTPKSTIKHDDQNVEQVKTMMPLAF